MLRLGFGWGLGLVLGLWSPYKSTAGHTRVLSSKVHEQCDSQSALLSDSAQVTLQRWRYRGCVPYSWYREPMQASFCHCYSVGSGYASWQYIVAATAADFSYKIGFIFLGRSWPPPLTTPPLLYYEM